MRTLHDADRGGFIFAPEVGLHENIRGTSHLTSFGVTVTATAPTSPASDIRSATTGATSSTCYS